MMDDFYSADRASPEEPSRRRDSAVERAGHEQSILSALAPRLMLLHRVKANDRSGEERPAAISTSESEAFLDALLRDPMDGTSEFETRSGDVDAGGWGAADRDRGAALATPRDLVKAARARGASERDIAEGFYGHAARAIGEFWENDTLSLVDVTIASCRLHDLLRADSGAESQNGEAASVGEANKSLPGGIMKASGDAPRLLIGNLLEDQHTFGAALVEKAFREAGWRVANALGADGDFIAAQLSREHFDVLGLSASNSFVVSDAADEIASLRRASINTNLKIFVGGRVFADEPSLVAEIRADGWAKDAFSAPDLAANLLEARLRHS